MNEQLISLETAKLAKEKGFDRIKIVSKNNIEAAYNAPTQSLLAKWLREVHKIVVYITPNYDLVFSEIDSYYGIVNNQYGEEEFICSNKTYEASLEAGLLNALQLIK